MFWGLRKAEELIVMVVTLLAYGCRRQAIVHAFGLDETNRACNMSEEQTALFCLLVES
jgi:hypothetical protein